MAATFAFLHHLAAFALVAALAVELVLLRDPITLGNARRLLAVDGIYGAAATVLLIVGFARVFHYEKGAYYYFHSWAFTAKLSLFVLLALVSIIPTLTFFSWRATVRQGQVPQLSAERQQRLRMIVHLELMGVVFILLCAALMAKGIGTMS